MTDRHHEDELPRDPEEERAAAALRDALEGRPAPDESGDLASLVGAARRIASASPPALGTQRQERVWGRIEARRRGSRSWLRWIWAGAAAAAVMVLVIALYWPPAAAPPTTPYRQVFRAPFDRRERPLDRLTRIIAWRRGSETRSGR